jgi:nucleoside-diphosphate-sugar epimerase
MKRINRTAFVTGAEGFIGSHLIKFLHAKGWKVIAGCLRHDSDSLPRSENLCFAQCDLRNGQRVTQLLAQYQPTHIFHLGAQSLPKVSWADPVETLSVTSWDHYICLRQYVI